MKNKRIFGIVVMLLVASMTIFAQSAASRDLQTELKKFWPDKDTYDKSVWNLAPIHIDQIVVRSVEGAPPLFTSYINGREEHFTYVLMPAEFDSEYYKQIHASLPMVKGTICYYTSDYRTDEVFIVIIEDNRILDYGREHATQKYRAYDNCWVANKSDWTNLNEMAGDKFDFGVPIVEYTDDKGSRNSFRVSPDNIVHLYMVCHPVGNFMEAHRGQKLDQVRVAQLNKTQENAVKIIKEFKNDYLYPAGVTFVFDNKKKESYQIYKTISGNVILASLDFFFDWKP
jgi:hypothetical protein